MYKIQATDKLLLPKKIAARNTHASTASLNNTTTSIRTQIFIRFVRAFISSDYEIKNRVKTRSSIEQLSARHGKWQISNKILIQF